MTRILAALTTATLLAAAGPAAAFSVSVDFPRLTFPEQPEPVSTQSCADMTVLTGQACSQPAK